MSWSEKAISVVRLYSRGSVLEYLRDSRVADRLFSETHRIVTSGHLNYHIAG
jgi:hypothetical protein